MSDSDKPDVVIVSIEGGIGVGKSTVMAALRAQRPSLCYIDEPVASWEKSGLLDAMYKGTLPKGTFQIAALATRMAPLLKAVRKGERLIVTERCPWSDLRVFTEANLDAGSVELDAYKMAYDALMAAMPKKVHLATLYLTADVPTLEARMAKRARSAESVDDDEARAKRRVYLELLQDKQDRFANMTAAELGIARYSCMYINSLQDPQSVAQTAEYALNRVAPVKLERVPHTE